MIYTNKMQIFYTKIRFATKICKVLFISHGRARIDTDMRNISVDQCNQWELMSHGRAQISTEPRNISVISGKIISSILRTARAHEQPKQKRSFKDNTPTVLQNAAAQREVCGKTSPPYANHGLHLSPHQ